MSRPLKIIFLILASGSLYYYLISPLYTGVGDYYKPDKGITSLKSLDKDYDATLLQAQGISARAEGLKRTYKAITDEDKQKLNIILPETVDQVVLLNEVNTIFNKSGFKIDSLTYNKGVSRFAGNIGAYTLIISTKGTYEHFKNLVHNLETSMHFYTIKSLGFSTPLKDGEIKDREPMVFSLKLETYYLKQ